MNGKFLLLLFWSLNIVSIIFSFGMIQAGNEVFVNNYIIETFMGEQITTSNIDILLDDGSVPVSGGLENALESMTKQDSAGTGSDFGFFAILDGLKMILVLISLLTPLPFLSFFTLLGMPFWVNMIIGFTAVLFYIVAWAEFIGNRKF